MATNQVFFIAPSPWIPLRQEKIFYYPWDLEKSEVRFIASWNTSDDGIMNLRAVIAEIALTPIQMEYP